ncbi:DUF4625 domain-containing protein [Carboxylicivirga sp. A043]|uniref:DUF4625 domain-containing protein n=1 Tax=Carboxylicivirga litoralis TaxID=2816963 RepID=UPI0021CB0F47|nr:DUF4625 domain-containing protein [Carboxylicivirga sp. A043]MCU4155053.1 DUF4625 domain-containing protein [Carboxylicivirga sp. A043]
MKSLLNYIAIGILAMFAACSSDSDSVDLEKPTAIIQLEKEDGVYGPGHSIIINASFMDNEALKECQVSIASQRSLKGWDTDWDVEMHKINLSGTEMQLSATRVLEDIPTDIYYGDYQLSFKVLDEANNYNIYTIDITIQ